MNLQNAKKEIESFKQNKFDLVCIEICSVILILATFFNL